MNTPSELVERLRIWGEPDNAFTSNRLLKGDCIEAADSIINLQANLKSAIHCILTLGGQPAIDAFRAELAASGIETEGHDPEEGHGA